MFAAWRLVRRRGRGVPVVDYRSYLGWIVAGAVVVCGCGLVDHAHWRVDVVARVGASSFECVRKHDDAYCWVVGRCDAYHVWHRRGSFVSL